MMFRYRSTSRKSLWVTTKVGRCCDLKAFYCIVKLFPHMHCVCFSMYLSIEVCVHMSFCMEMGGNCMSLSHVLQLVGSVATHSVLPSSSTPTATVTVQQLPSLNPTSRTMLWWGHSPLFFLYPLSSLWVIAAHWQNASSIQFFLFLTSEPIDSSPTFPFAVYCLRTASRLNW